MKINGPEYHMTIYLVIAETVFSSLDTLYSEVLLRFD